MADLFTELLNSIRSLPITENYSPKERYQDFRQVFTGTEQGKRVYRELLSWGKMFASSVYGDPIDPLRMAKDQAVSDFSKKILATVEIEPPEQPTKAVRKPTRSK